MFISRQGTTPLVLEAWNHRPQGREDLCVPSLHVLMSLTSSLPGLVFVTILSSHSNPE